MIGIVNYGLGNIQAFVNIFKLLNINVKVVENCKDLDEHISKLILPGVGTFDWAMGLLDGSGLRERLEYKVLVEKCPILGVCVGMQILCNRSEEGQRQGLGWIDAEVKKLYTGLDSNKLQLPHMGWNTIIARQDSVLYKELVENPSFYFLHSYYVALQDQQLQTASADYGIEFSAALQSDNIFGTQFHPEKSHKSGIQLLKNFAEFQYVAP